MAKFSATTGVVPGLADISPDKEIVPDPCVNAQLPSPPMGVDPTLWNNIFRGVTQMIGPAERRNWAATIRNLSQINQAPNILNDQGMIEVVNLFVENVNNVENIHVNNIYVNNITYNSSTPGNGSFLWFTLTAPLSGGAANANVTAYQGPNPGAAIVVHDTQALFPKGLIGAKGFAAFNPTTGFFEVVQCNQQATYIKGVLGGTLQSTDATGSISSVAALSNAPFGQSPATPLTVDNPLAMAAANGKKVRCLWNHAAGTYEIIGVELVLKTSQQYTYRFDESNGNFYKTVWDVAVCSAQLVNDESVVQATELCS